MRTRISRRLLLPLFLVLLSVALAGALVPAEGKGGFCPGVCGESLPLRDAFGTVTYE